MIGCAGGPRRSVRLFMCARDTSQLRACVEAEVAVAEAAVSDAALTAGEDLLAATKAAGDVEGTTVLAVQQAAVTPPRPPDPLLTPSRTALLRG